MKLVHKDYYNGIKKESLKDKKFKLLFKKDNFQIEECFFNNKSFLFLIYLTNMNHMLPFLITNTEKNNIIRNKSLKGI